MIQIGKLRLQEARHQAPDHQAGGVDCEAPSLALCAAGWGPAPPPSGAPQAAEEVAVRGKAQTGSPGVGGAGACEGAPPILLLPGPEHSPTCKLGKRGGK